MGNNKKKITILLDLENGNKKTKDVIVIMPKDLLFSLINKNGKTQREF